MTKNKKIMLAVVWAVFLPLIAVLIYMAWPRVVWDGYTDVRVDASKEDVIINLNKLKGRWIRITRVDKSNNKVFIMPIDATLYTQNAFVIVSKKHHEFNVEFAAPYEGVEL